MPSPSRVFPAILVSLGLLAAPALAQQSTKQPYRGQGNGYVQQPQQGESFSFEGDQVPPSHDSRSFNRYDPRYSQNYQQQQAQIQQEREKPGGGCLRYGAVGAAAGHLAGHGVLGAVAGCLAGRVVRNRDRARIEQQQGPQ